MSCQMKGCAWPEESNGYCAIHIREGFNPPDGVQTIDESMEQKLHRLRSIEIFNISREELVFITLCEWLPNNRKSGKPAWWKAASLAECIEKELSRRDYILSEQKL